jgi:hypothetical protein
LKDLERRPEHYFVYPINNFFAFFTAFFALALAVEEVTWRRGILLRGAAFRSVVASLSGAYILGIHKIDRAAATAMATARVAAARFRRRGTDSSVGARVY